MALVQIFSLDGLEIEFQKQSLTLKKENNSLSSDFKVPHSSFPFLVIENENTKKALGPSDITSIRKSKIIPVIILENGVRYYGELQQLTVLPKFRKCNLKYGSAILEIVNKKISEFLPRVSVIPGENSPIPFVEENSSIVAGSEHWETFPVTILGAIFPSAKFQFPKMLWKNKFGVDLDATDPWYSYQNYINNFTTNSSNQRVFVKNTVTISGSNVTVSNKNVPSPQLFLLTPLHYIFSQINYNVTGNFVSNNFIRKLLMLSFKDNICKSYILKQNSTNITLSPLAPQGNLFYYSLFTLNTVQSGRYVFNKSFIEQQFTSTSGNLKRFEVVFKGFSYGFYQHSAGSPTTTYNEEFVIDVLTADVGTPIYVTYLTVQNSLPLNYTLNYYITSIEKNFNQMHPTIELGRYAPDWSVGNYLNYIKNQFNLDITLDDFKKEIILNFNEDIIDFETPFEITKSLAMKSFDLAANSSFIIKYENSEDTALFIDKNGVSIFQNQGDDFTKTIQSKFKYVKHNGNTAELSEEFKDLEGIGLMIYEPDNAPNISLNADGLNLKIDGAGGIYEKFFKSWLNFLLNASYCELNGFFTDNEVFKINQSKSVYVNNQRFRIIDIEITEASNNYQEVKMKLASVNY